MLVLKYFALSCVLQMLGEWGGGQPSQPRGRIKVHIKLSPLQGEGLLFTVHTGIRSIKLIPVCIHF